MPSFDLSSENIDRQTLAGVLELLNAMALTINTSLSSFEPLLNPNIVNQRETQEAIRAALAELETCRERIKILAFLNDAPITDGASG